MALFFKVWLKNQGMIFWCEEDCPCFDFNLDLIVLVYLVCVMVAY